MFNKLRQSRYLQYLSVIAATLSVAASAMHSYWTSPSLPILESDESPIGRPITDEEGSWIASLFKLGILPGLLGGWIAEKYGRKKTLLIGGAMLIAPWFMIILASNVVILYIARFIAGTGEGILIISCSIYNSEIPENDIRGRLGTSLMVLKITGSLIVLCVGPYVSYTNLAIICSAFPVLFVAVFIFMPETPYYLIKANKNEEAEKNLRRLCSNQADNKFIINRMDEMEKCVTEDMQNKTTIWEFCSNKEYRKAIFIMAGIKTIQQFSGQAAISSYMQSIIELTGSNLSSEVSSIIFGSLQIPAVLLSSFLVDKLGRRPLLLVSCLGCAVSLFAEGTYFYFQDALGADVSSIAWLPTTAIALFAIMNPLGIVTLPYVLVGELFPTNIKGIAVSTATLYGASLAFFVTKYFKPIANALGIYTAFWFFGSTCTLGAIFVILFLPETKGKSFAEIQAILRNRKNKDIEEIESSYFSIDK